MTNEEIMQLWEAHRPFVYKIALRYTVQAEIDDLLQEGYLGFYAAATRFDGSVGTSFLTYAGFWVRQRMRRYIENCCSVVRISSGMAEKVRIDHTVLPQINNRSAIGSQCITHPWN